MCRRRIVRRVAELGSRRAPRSRSAVQRRGRICRQGVGWVAGRRRPRRDLALARRVAGTAPHGTRDAAPTDEHRPGADEPPAAPAEPGGCPAPVAAPSRHRCRTLRSPSTGRGWPVRVNAASAPGQRFAASWDAAGRECQPRRSVMAPTQTVIRQPIPPMTARNGSPPTHDAAATPPNIDREHAPRSRPGRSARATAGVDGARRRSPALGRGRRAVGRRRRRRPIGSPARSRRPRR